MKNTRQRGVKASRIKLEHFMLEAGIKSQAELARKIADIEGLDSEPKDLVNRIFRQIKVEHNSLERVAKALNIDAYKLYLTQDDQTLITENKQASTTIHSASEPPKSSLFFNFKVLQVVIFVFVLMLSGYYFSKLEKSDITGSKNESILLYPANKSLYSLAQDIIATQKNQRIGLVPLALFDDFNLNNNALSKYEVDAIWVLEEKESGRYISLFLKKYMGEKPLITGANIENNNTLTVAAINLSKNEFEQAHSYIAQVFLTTLNQQIDEKRTVIGEKLRKQSSTIIQARQLTEQYFNKKNIANAIQLLNTLTTPNAESLAVQCLIKVQVGWQHNEKKEFEQAQNLCEKALILDSHSPFALTTNAYRLFRNGQYEKAARAYHRILEQSPNNIEGLLGQAELNLKFYLEAPDDRKMALSNAITQAQKAILHDPMYWKSYNLLGNLFYLSNQPHKALDVIKKLNEIAPNQMSLANGALLSLCHNKLNDATKYSKQMVKLDPTAYLAHETMFYIHAYKGQLAEALYSMKKAVSMFQNNQGGLYMQWGELADAFRWLGQTESAIKYYKKALVEFEQDKIKKQTTENDQVFSLYYQAAIERMKQQKLSIDIQTQLDKLDVNSMPSANQLKAAIIYKWFNQDKLTLMIKNHLVEICPIYQKAVDLI